MKQGYANNALNTGDILEFGTYPQSEVTDGIMRTVLDALEKHWRFCGGDSSIRIADVLYKNKKYRAVCFSSYRLTCTDCQKNNGYLPNEVYYFCYEPVRWRVLDSATGLILSETILDSQAFNDHITSTVNYHLEYGSVHDAVNIYERSSIRQWLNDEFLNTAFTPVQQELIEKRPYSVSNPEDQIFLIDAGDAAFQYFSSSDARQAKGSDYAKCCGLQVDAKNGFSAWRLRGGTMSGSVYDTDNLDYVFSDGSVDYNYGTITDASYGVRPALKRKDLSSRVSQKETAVSTAGESTHENIFRKYTGSEETVVIPEGVTIIGIEAFQKCKSLKSIIIPDGVKIIGVKAFDDCENLTSVTLPDSVTFIRFFAFAGCKSLKTVYYGGTKEQRKRIKIEPNGGDCLLDAEWIYNARQVLNGKAKMGMNILTKCADAQRKGLKNMKHKKQKKFPSFGEWRIQKEKEKGILVFRDKGDKFLETQHSLAILTNKCDIKIDSQVVDGKYRWLLIEVSPMGSLDRETFERDPNAPAVFLKTEYESTHPNTLFSTAKNSGRLMRTNIKLGQFKTYIAEKGLRHRNITEEEYNDPNYVF